MQILLILLKDSTFCLLTNFSKISSTTFSGIDYFLYIYTIKIKHTIMSVVEKIGQGCSGCLGVLIVIIICLIAAIKILFNWF